MAVSVEGVVVYGARAKWAQQDVGAATHKKFSYFKLGEGGWEDVGGVRTPKTPNPALADLDCVENPGSYPADSRYVWDSRTAGTPKFRLVDLVFEAPRTAKAICLCDFTDANDDGLGNPPEFWEIGIFDEDGTMIVYGTFPKETKTSDRQLEKHCRLTR